MSHLLPRKIKKACNPYLDNVSLKKQVDEACILPS